MVRSSYTGYSLPHCRSPHSNRPKSTSLSFSKVSDLLSLSIWRIFLFVNRRNYFCDMCILPLSVLVGGEDWECTCWCADLFDWLVIWGNIDVIRAALNLTSVWFSWLYLFTKNVLSQISAVVVIQGFMTGVNVCWVYLAPENIPSATVLTLGNKAVLLLLSCSK